MAHTTLRPCDGCDRLPNELADLAQILESAEYGDDWRLVRAVKTRLAALGQRAQGQEGS